MERLFLRPDLKNPTTAVVYRDKERSDGAELTERVEAECGDWIIV